MAVAGFTPARNQQIAFMAAPNQRTSNFGPDRLKFQRFLLLRETFRTPPVSAQELLASAANPATPEAAT